MQHVHDVRCTLGAKSVIYDCLVSFRQPKLIVERRVIAKVVRQSYKRSIVMSMFVCLSLFVCLFICPRAHLMHRTSNFAKFSMYVDRGRG